MKTTITNEQITKHFICLIKLYKQGDMTKEEYFGARMSLEMLLGKKVYEQEIQKAYKIFTESK